MPNPFVLRMAKTLSNFGCFECNRIKLKKVLKLLRDHNIYIALLEIDLKGKLRKVFARV